MPGSSLTARTVVPLLLIALVAGLATGWLTADRPNTSDTAGLNSTPSTVASDEPTEADDSPGIEVSADKPSVGEFDEITISGTVTPPQSGVSLKIQRRLEGEDDWSDFPASPSTTKSDGSFRFVVKSGREGPNTFRVVPVAGDEDLSSPDVVVTVTN